MKHIQSFEGLTNWRDNKSEYYVQRGKGYEELVKIKTDILESMNPPIIEVWENLSDSLLDIVEKWGKFRSKYENDREVVDFTSLDLVLDIGKETYTIAHEGDTFYNRGSTLKILDRTEKEKYRKFYPDGSERKYDSRLSMYGSKIDQEFYDFYKKNNGKVKPVYNFLIGFDTEYVENNTDRLNEMISDLSKNIKNSIKRINGKIVKLEYFPAQDYVPGKSIDWKKINDLSQMKYPRLSVYFVIN